MTARVRHRQVSAERIAKVAEALGRRVPVHSVQLLVDGSAQILTGDGALTSLRPRGDEPNEWDEVLTGSA